MKAFWYVPRLLFGLRELVSRPTYIILGGVLAVARFHMERSTYSALGHPFGVVDFLTPVLFRNRALYVRPDGLVLDQDLLAAVEINLPFLWLGFSLSARRAMDATRSPLVALLFFVPGVNYLLAAVLSVLPSRVVQETLPATPGDYQHAPKPAVPTVVLLAEEPDPWVRLAQGMLLGAVVFIGVCGYLVVTNGGDAIGLAIDAGLIGGYLAMGGSRRSAHAREATLSGAPKPTGNEGAPKRRLGCALALVVIVPVFAYLANPIFGWFAVGLYAGLRVLVLPLAGAVVVGAFARVVPERILLPLPPDEARSRNDGRMVK